MREQELRAQQRAAVSAWALGRTVTVRLQIQFTASGFGVLGSDCRSSFVSGRLLTNHCSVSCKPTIAGGTEGGWRLGSFPSEGAGAGGKLHLKGSGPRQTIAEALRYCTTIILTCT